MCVSATTTGPVHITYRNAVLMLNILHEAGIKTNLENENAGTLDDSMTAVILASFLHDLGMTIGRQDHELYSMTLATPIIDRILEKVYPDELGKRVIIRSLAMEGIIGHMAARRIHSLEAGLILIADGCDMEKGRARRPMVLNTEPKVGDIHKYSANSIEKVKITAGDPKPVRISIDMSSDVGFFQIEEVLLPKVNMSPGRTKSWPAFRAEKAKSICRDFYLAEGIKIGIASENQRPEKDGSRKSVH